jgi:glycosyltransferase 2 family protein
MADEVVPAISPSVKKWILVSALIGYVVLLFFLFFFIDIGKLLSVLGSVNLSIYMLALISVIISITFHALVWFQLLNSVSIKLGFRRTYVLYWVGVFVDNLVPGGWSGDLFKAYLLSRDPELDSGRAVASVVAKNVYEAIFNLGSMILGLTLLLLTYDLPENGILLSIGGIMVLLTLPLVILLVVSFKPKGAKRVMSFLIRLLSRINGKRWNLTNLQATMEKVVDDYHEGMQLLLENPRMLFKPMILSFFAWGFEVVALLLVFASLGMPISVDKVIIVRAIAGNVESQGYAFAGYAQIITIGIYTALNVPIEFGTSVALLGGLVIFWLKTGISYAAFHCTVFSPCANFVCRAIGVGGVAGNKPCKTKEHDDAKEQANKS